MELKIFSGDLLSAYKYFAEQNTRADSALLMTPVLNWDNEVIVNSVGGNLDLTDSANNSITNGLL